jgi:hypothetical protein
MVAICAICLAERGTRMQPTRRRFLTAVGLSGSWALAAGVLGKAKAPFLRDAYASAGKACPFRLSVINDEISQDFENVCRIVAEDFGLGWIELRSMWNKNVTDLNARETEEARKILEKYHLQVTDIASPLFKTDWPGAPRSPRSRTERPSTRSCRRGPNTVPKTALFFCLKMRCRATPRLAKRRQRY